MAKRKKRIEKALPRKRSEKPKGDRDHSEGRAFVFKDRTGKVHQTLRKNHGESHQEESHQEKFSRRSAGGRHTEGGKKRDTQWGSKRISHRDGPRGSERGFGRDSEKNTDHGRSRRDFKKGSKKDSYGDSRGSSRGESRGDFRRGSKKGQRKDQKRNQRKNDREKSSFAERALEPGMTLLKASIDKNRRGFAFLVFENRDYEDAFLNPREAEKYFHGDRVEAIVDEDGQIYDLRVIAHRFRELVGRYFSAGKKGLVVYERKKTREEISVRGSHHGAQSKDWVRAKIHYHEEEYPRFHAEILEVYGAELPASADIQMVAAEYSLIEEHSQAAIREAESFTLDVHKELQTGKREDLREIPFVTIDGETARDFDDAIYVERNREGYTLWVAIADVSHYVTEGSLIDQEAYSRGTSVYFPERAFHMLPRALSENLCSLIPNEPRLALVAQMQFNAQGIRQSTQLKNAIIQSHRRATYNEVHQEWLDHHEDPSWSFTPHYELYAKLRKNKTARGSIDFDLPEAEVLVQPTGEPISIKNRPRLDAHRLIEEFMIAANEAVTTYALEKKWPFIYRVHDEPTFKAIEKFQELCANSGVSFMIRNQSLSFSLAKLIKTIEGHPAQTVLNMALLRSMPQAHYSAVHGQHFGLASQAYTHFTSPIRRYPDLVVHRLLKSLIQKSEPMSPEKLGEIAEHCSYRERIATDAERESIKLKQVRIMIPEVGNEFDGKINGMMENGFFVVLDEPFVEGVVPKESLGDDHYEFQEEKMLFVGRRKKNIFRIGDRVRIRVDRADIDLRLIDFAFIERIEPNAVDSKRVAARARL